MATEAQADTAAARAYAMTPFAPQAALLHAIAAEEVGFGLTLVAQVAERSGGVIVLGTGSAWAALEALERAELLRSFHGAPIPGRRGRPRKYYQIVEAGKVEARRQRAGILGLLG